MSSPSPRFLATWPPKRATAPEAACWYCAMRSRHSSASSCCESGVEPTRSQKSTVSWRRSPAGNAASGSGAGVETRGRWRRGREPLRRSRRRTSRRARSPRHTRRTPPRARPRIPRRSGARRGCRGHRTGSASRVFSPAVTTTTGANVGTLRGWGTVGQQEPGNWRGATIGNRPECANTRARRSGEGGGVTRKAAGTTPCTAMLGGWEMVGSVLSPQIREAAAFEEGSQHSPLGDSFSGVVPVPECVSVALLRAAARSAAMHPAARAVPHAGSTAGSASTCPRTASRSCRRIARRVAVLQPSAPAALSFSASHCPLAGL